jgi:hypothetical protein
VLINPEKKIIKIIKEGAGFSKGKAGSFFLNRISIFKPTCFATALNLIEFTGLKA